MDCASCGSKIDTAVRRMSGVEDVSVSVAAGNDVGAAETSEPRIVVVFDGGGLAERQAAYDKRVVGCFRRLV